MKINSSLQMPDRVLNFVKDHFLMNSPLRSAPLLLQSRLRYQQLSVDHVEGLHGTYHVLFLGTGRSHGVAVGTGAGTELSPGPSQHGLPGVLQMTGGCTRL